MAGNDSEKIYVSESFLALMVILVALTVRALHVIFTSRFNPLADDLVLDAAGYDLWAKTLVWGGPPPGTQLMQSPLFPWFLSGVYRIFGPSLTAARAVQAVLGTVTCALMTVYSRRLFRSSSAGIAAGLAAALYMPSIFYEGVLVPATLALFLNALFLFVMAPETGPPSQARLLLAGFVLGLAALNAPVSLLILPFALAHILLRARKYACAEGAADTPRPPGARPRGALAGKALLFSLGILAALVPLAIRNYRLAGEFIPFTTGGGINFYIGNNPAANGFYSVPLLGGESLGGTPEEQNKRMKSIAERETGRALGPSQVSGFWISKGVEYGLENPGRWASLIWKKALYFWNAHERANVENMNFHRRFGGVLALPLLTFGVAAPLGLLGIFMTRERWSRLWLLYGGAAAYFLSALIFYVLARYRLPVAAFLLPLAGAAAAGIIKLLAGRKLLECFMMIIALAILWNLVNLPLVKDSPFGISSALTRVGTALERRGDTAGALEAYREALEMDPKNQRAREGLGRVNGR